MHEAARCDICLNIGIIREKLIGLGVKGIPRNHACSIEVAWCLFRKKEPLPTVNGNFHNTNCDENCDEILYPIPEGDKNGDEYVDSSGQEAGHKNRCDENGDEYVIPQVKKQVTKIDVMKMVTNM